MTTVTPAAAYWTAVLAEATDSDRADAIAALLASGTKIKLYDSGGSLLRTVTTDAWAKGALSNNAYPLTPGAFTDAGTGTGTPTLAVFTKSDDTELFRCSAGVLSGVLQLPSALASGVALTAGSLSLSYPSSDVAAPTGRRWQPGHYFYCADEVNHGPMLDRLRNKVRYNAYFKGYHNMYWWASLEPTKGNYDFSMILSDLDKTAADGKYMWVRLMDRSFHGYTRGTPIPAYIGTDYDGIWASQTDGGATVSARFWDPAVAERYLLFVEAMMAAIDDHPALQGVYTEEAVIAGAYLEPGWTWQKMNAYILEFCRVGSEGAVNSLWHQNMGWSNESSTDTTEHYRMTDTIVRTYKAGLSPTDLRLSTSTATLNTVYGKYIYDRYAGETFFGSNVEWYDFFLPEGPKALIDFGVDTLGLHFIAYQEGPASGGTFTGDDCIAEVTRQLGRINTSRPLSVPE